MINHRFTIGLVLCVFLIGGMSRFVFAQSSLTEVEQEKSQLQKQLQQIENQIAEYEQELKVISGEKNTLQKKIRLLQNQQSTLGLKIQETSLEVDDMDQQIQETVSTITQNEEQIGRIKSQLMETLQQVNENDHRSLFLLFFSGKTLFDALKESQQFTQVTDELGVLLSRLRESQTDMLTQKDYLDERQAHMQNLLAVQSLQKQALAGSVQEQAVLLKQTKGKEQNYQAVLSDTKQEAEQIKTRLYQMLNVGKQITFGQAVEIAQWVSNQTGVRAAFLLAVLTQESNLGKNVGTCNRPGDPPSKSWKVIMKPTRDQEPFKTITSELGLDIETTAVSCPMRDKKGNQIGWGGAMGPAQFIPSTWMGYRNKVTAITGSPANPWDIRDAFIASGLKLGADGAKTIDGEWAAAMRYFSGSTNVRFRFYGDQVVATANAYQKDIDAL